MLIKAFNKNILFGTTVIAGFAALSVMGAPAYAQSGTMGTPNRPADPPAAQPGVAQPNSDDQADVTQEDTAEDAVDPADDEAEVEAVVVTGSRIRRDPTNSPTPLIQLNREEILQSGEPNIVDYLADVPALQLSQVPEDTTGASLGAGGLSLLNLRGLGAVRTLTLVDGRRHVGGSPGTSAVDVDTIPSLLIESTEIITGGASAQYGADAVSGVVNFILRRNFEGIELDGSFGQINQENNRFNKRASGLIGHNFFDDRLNVYAFGEYQQTDRVLDADIDFLREGRATFQNDLDPPNPNATTIINSDGVIDVVTRSGVGNLTNAIGRSLTLAREVRPSTGFIPGTSTVADPDFPVADCRPFGPTTPADATCFVLDPGFTFVFNNQGVGRDANFGTDRAQAGLNRGNVVGSPDALPFTAFQADRLPESEAKRFQTGVNFDLTENLQLFGEVKYVEEITTFDFQPFSAGLLIREFGAREVQPVGGFTFQLGLDNAFLDENIRTRIRNNTRQDFDLRPTITVGGVAQPNPNFGAPMGAPVADRRAFLRGFFPELGQREQVNTRETLRYVLGARGDRDQLGFLRNLSYEIGYTYGEVEDLNDETGTIDFERVAFGADAVRDVNNVTGKGANSIVCRVQLLSAQGVAIPRAAGGTYAATDPAITGCTPFRIFGEGGIGPEVVAYTNVSQTSSNRNEQEDALAFVSGELFDFFGAGPIGFAVGAEYRKETASGVGSVGQNVGRSLFANAIANFPERSFDVTEYFGELRVPLLKDLPFAESLEFSVSGRRSDYSTLGESDTYGISGIYKPTRDFLFRASYGRAVRAPNISELFQPLSQTFAQLTDRCSRNIIDATADDRIRNNRNRNCAALGVPATYLDPQPGFTNPGRFGGNEQLDVETADSYTFSIGFTPRFARGFSAVLDFYDIKITNAIASLTAQAILDQCTDLDVANPNACALITRDPASFEIIDFVQAPVNFAGLRTSGMDFNARYGFELADLDFIGRDIGRLDLSVRGTYLIRRRNFVNPTNPGLATDLDATTGYPRVRALFGATYSLDKFAFSYELDYQTSQEITDSRFLLTDTDNRSPDLLQTGSFAQHDFSVRYDVTDAVRLRAGVVNAFDAEPSLAAELLGGGNFDIFDLFGRRFFVGLNLRFGAAVD